MKVGFIVGAAIAGAIALGGCSNGDQAKINAWGQDHVIKQFSGGQLIGQWESTGKVSNETQSDGYYFQDKAAGKMVTVSGTVQITVK
jgi:hypothetical protein